MLQQGKYVKVLASERAWVSRFWALYNTLPKSSKNIFYNIVNNLAWQVKSEPSVEPVYRNFDSEGGKNGT
jgi:hypothetical protein